MDLEAEVLEALRPRGAADRFRMLLTGGLAPVQVLGRLPEATRWALSEGANATVARRGAVEEVILALDALIQAGRVRRRRLRLKNAIVDVYRER